MVIAVAYLTIFYLISSFLANSDGEAGSGKCIPYHKIGLAHGEHGGRQWRIGASIEKIERRGQCSYWFLKVNFSPNGRSRGSWIEGWSVPAGGHLPLDATIDAYEAEDGRSIGGVVGSRVRTVILWMTGGRTVVFHPQVPSHSLRERFVWLRGLRYFLWFHPAGEHPKMAKLLDGTGKVLYTAHSQEGELIGNMVD